MLKKKKKKKKGCRLGVGGGGGGGGGGACASKPFDCSRKPRPQVDNDRTLHRRHYNIDNTMCTTQCAQHNLSSYVGNSERSREVFQV